LPIFHWVDFTQHATQRNTPVMGAVKGGAVTFAYAEDAKKNFIIQCK
jgi:hypothetical protein